MGSSTATHLPGARTQAVARSAVAGRHRRSAIKSPKVDSAAQCRALEQLPNIGPAVAASLRRIGIHEPGQLRGADAFALYQRLCAATGQRHDPCVLDTFMAAVDFMNGATAAPWWAYTPQRRLRFGKI